MAEPEAEVLRQRRARIGGDGPDFSCDDARRSQADGVTLGSGPEAKNASGCGDEVKRPGRVKLFFNSRQWKALLLCIVSATPVFGLVVCMPKLTDPAHPAGRVIDHIEYSKHFAFAVWAATQFLFNMILAAFRSGGDCKAYQPTTKESGEFAVHGHPEFTHAPMWCTKCQHWKTPRAHHCSTCRRCTPRMDHHCPFVGNCIGANNHGNYLLMFFFAMLGLGYASCLLALTLKNCAGSVAKRYLRRHHVFKWRTAIAFVLSDPVAMFRQLDTATNVFIVMVAISTFFVVLIGLNQISIAAGGSTTLEHAFPQKAGLVKVLPQTYCPLGLSFYHQGYFRNLQMLLGSRWWLRLIIPLPGGPDPDVAAYPKPCSTGIMLLKQRAKECWEVGPQRRVDTMEELLVEHEGAHDTKS